MIKEALLGVNVLKYYAGKHGVAVLEVNKECNRRCDYCLVPRNYDKEKELTVDETLKQVDWLYKQGFRLISILGGEPLAPFKTKENITFLDHTKKTIEYAKSKGMAVNVTTNGDYVNEEVIKSLKMSGLDTLTFSLHSDEKSDLNLLIEKAKILAKYKLIPTIHALFTRQNADKIVDMAYEVAKNGILFRIGIVQEKGMGFSALPKEGSAIPTLDQQKQVLEKLLKLKSYGFVADSKNYLSHAMDFPNNNWKCDPEKDAFIHVGTGGFVNVCSEVRTNMQSGEIDLTDEKWRDEKRKLVGNCGNCLSPCWYDSENPNLIGDIPTLLIAGLIKSGHSRSAEKIGEFAVKRRIQSQSETQ